MKIAVIDTFGFLFRSYHALPPLKSKSGFPTGLLSGFIKFISSLDDDYIIFALDSEAKKFRTDIDINYKAHRKTPDSDLMLQLELALKWLDTMGFKSVKADGFEADDVIATICKCAKKQGLRVKIISHDKDLYQLIDDNFVSLFDPISKKEINESGVVAKYGVSAKEFIDYQSLIGDSSDGVKGVSGIGAKKAVALLSQFKTLENIYANIDLVAPLRVKQLLIDGKSSAFVSKQLVTLRDDIFEEFDFSSCKSPKNPILTIEQELIELDIIATLNRVKKSQIAEEIIKFDVILLDNFDKLIDVIDKITEDKIIAFDCETTSLNVREAKLVGFSFAYNFNESYYVPIAHNSEDRQVPLNLAIDGIKRLFKFKIVGQNIKYDLEVLQKYVDIKDVKIVADTMVLSWLIEPSMSANLTDLAKRELNYNMLEFSSIVPKNQSFADVPLNIASFYAGEDANITYRLYFKLLNILKEKNYQLIDELEIVEIPFIKSLIMMESSGVALDINRLEILLKECENLIEDLKDKIYKLAGVEFNINSTKQLSEVLFTNLKLKPTKKTKTGFSTDEEVLEDLIDEHLIIKELLNYREIYKLKSTYIEPLLNMNENRVIYTNFLHTGTNTGRLSSINPNLQNIPIKSEFGKLIRDVFIARDGYKLVGIDYSQIELRLLAHFSCDEVLVSAFRDDKDIHLETAIKLFGDEGVNKRAIAKSINFGLIYGMGVRKLSKTLNISQDEAKSYMDSYFNSFPTIKEYIQTLQSKIKLDGYVETLLNRRRYFNFENSKAYLESSYLREGVNTLFQGSSADIIKLSMNEIYKYIVDENLDAKILLQIHDELLIEVREDLAFSLGEKFKSIMENSYKLNVPLKANLKIGSSWGNLK